MQHEAHFKANLAGATCYYIPKVCFFRIFVKYYIANLNRTTTETTRAPIASDPDCMSDLLIDLQIGALGSPS